MADQKKTRRRTQLSQCSRCRLTRQVRKEHNRLICQQCKQREREQRDVAELLRSRPVRSPETSGETGWQLVSPLPEYGTGWSRCELCGMDRPVRKRRNKAQRICRPCCTSLSRHKTDMPCHQNQTVSHQKRQ